MNKYPYQWRALILMVAAWAVGGLAHNCVAFLFPVFSDEFSLDTQHNGYLTGVLALFWTFSIIRCQAYAKRYGQIVVIAAGLGLGALGLLLLSFAQSVMALYVLIAVIGLGCGAVVSPSLSFLAEQSAPEKRGLVFGVAQSSFTLIGSALGAVVFTRLGASNVGWRGSSLILAICIGAVAIILLSFGRQIPFEKDSDRDRANRNGFGTLLKYKNVVLSSVLACLTMMWYFTVAAFTILYLADAKSVTTIVAGVIFSGFGIGGFVGEFFAPMLSDYFGRKKTAMVASMVGGACFAVFVMVPLSKLVMCMLLALSACFMSGAMAIFNSVIPSESVPQALIPTATSFTPAAGELMGGVIAPVLAGVVSGIFGLSAVMHILIAFPFIICVVAYLLKETAPTILQKKKA